MGKKKNHVSLDFLHSPGVYGDHSLNGMGNYYITVPVCVQEEKGEI